MCRDHGMFETLGWSTLPFDVVELILANLSLVELARVSTTCSAFGAVSRTQMPREQKARCKLAVRLFGQERTGRIVALILHLLKEKPWSEHFLHGEWNECWISADGVLKGPAPQSLPHRMQPEHGDIRVWALPGTGDDSITHHSRIMLRAQNWDWSCITILFHRKGPGAVFDVVTLGDDDLEVVALLQALLNGGLAQFVQDEGQQLEVSVRRGRCGPISSRAVLRAQVAPLLPYAPRYSQVEKTLDEWEIFTTDMFIGGA
jgi:hypothetical protein